MKSITAAQAREIVANYRKAGTTSRTRVKRGSTSKASLITIVDLTKLLKKKDQHDLAAALAGEQQALYRLQGLKAMSPEAVRRDADAHQIALEGTQAALTRCRRQVRMILTAMQENGAVSTDEAVSTDVTVYWPTGRTTITEGTRVQALDTDGHKLEGEITRIGRSDVTLTQDDGETVVLPNPGTLMTVMVPITLDEKQQAALLDTTTPGLDRLVGIGLAGYRGTRLVLTEKGEFVAKEVKRTLFVRNANMSA